MAIASEPVSAAPRQRQQVTHSRTEKNRTKAFRAAARHSFVVGSLKLLLPITAVGFLSLFFISSDLSITIDGQTATVEAINISSDKLQMVNPRLEGFSEKNGAYRVTANAAYQQVSQPDVIELDQVQATVKNPAQGNIKVTAKKGIFYSKREHLDLTGDIRITSESGLSADLQVAEIDMKNQVMKSAKPVAVDLNGSTINAEQMVVHSDQRMIKFQKNVKARMKEQSQPSAPAPSQNTNGLDALALNRSKPIDITSDELTVYDDRKIAQFSGNVQAVQGGYKITSQTMDVAYEATSLAQQSGQNGSGDAAGIDRIVADGNVEIAAEDGRRASTNKLVFNRKHETMAMVGNVVLADGKNVLKGNELFTDLKTRQSAFKPGGRIHGHFIGSPGQSQTPVQPKTGAGGTAVAKIEKDKPVDIVADSASLDDTAKKATFKGNVRTVQGGYKINSDLLIVHYKGDLGNSSQAGNATKIEAKHNVHITTPDKQTAKADWATYNAKTEKLVLGGNISLLRGDDLLKGEKLVIDLKTGRSHLENSQRANNSGEKTRVRALFKPRQTAPQ